MWTRIWIFLTPLLLQVVSLPPMSGRGKSYCASNGETIVASSDEELSVDADKFAMSPDGVWDPDVSDEYAKMLWRKKEETLRIFVDNNQKRRDCLLTTCPADKRRRRRSLDYRVAIVTTSTSTVANRAASITGTFSGVISINLNFSDNTQLDIDCNSNGVLYVSNPDPVKFKSVSAYAGKGTPCKAGMRDDRLLVEVHGCHGKELIKVSFSPRDSHETIIRGNTNYQIYNINCTEYDDQWVSNAIRLVILDRSSRHGSPNTSKDVYFAGVLASICCGLLVLLILWFRTKVKSKAIQMKQRIIYLFTNDDTLE